MQEFITKLNQIVNQDKSIRDRSYDIIGYLYDKMDYQKAGAYRDDEIKELLEVALDLEVGNTSDESADWRHIERLAKSITEKYKGQ